LAKIVDRVFIYDDKVIAIALHGDYAVVLDNGGVAPAEIVEKLMSETTGGTNDNACTSCAQSGSDGGGSLACIILIFLPKHIVQKHLADSRLKPVILPSLQNNLQSYIFV
jgi:hypothetical protein